MGILDRVTRTARRRPELAPYVAVATGTALTGALGWDRAHAYFKTPLVPVLQVGLLSRRRQCSPRGLTALLLASAAGAVGDALLLPDDGPRTEQQQRRQLHLGATAFGLQQIGYIALLRQAGARPRLATTLPVLAALGGISLLDRQEGSGDVDLVLNGYGALLAAMGVHALGATGRSGAQAGLPLGGASFVASDAMIMLRELLLDGERSRALAEAFVLGSYALAQALIVGGLEETIRRPVV